MSLVPNRRFSWSVRLRLRLFACSLVSSLGPLTTISSSDVREPNEVVLGNIPSSVNLPMSTFEKALSMDEGESFLLIHQKVSSDARVV